MRLFCLLLKSLVLSKVRASFRMLTNFVNISKKNLQFFTKMLC